MISPEFRETSQFLIRTLHTKVRLEIAQKGFNQQVQQYFYNTVTFEIVLVVF